MLMAVPVTNKTKRLSLVAVTGAALALVWAIFDELFSVGWSPAIVSGVTSLAMLLAGFYDWKRQDTAVLFNGENNE